MASRVDFDFSFDARRRSPRARPDGERLRILVVSDLRGAGRAPFDPTAPLASARVQHVGIDDFDSFFTQLAPAVELSARAGEASSRISFRALTDFHPDALYESLDVLQALRASRARLCQPSTFAAERERLLADPPAGASADQGRVAHAAPAEEESAASTLGRLLGGAVARPAASSAVSAIDQLLATIVAPHVTASLPEQAQLIASVDAAISSELRAVLHDPAFQRLEGSWRALDWLVRENALGDELALSVLDASREQLLADLAACGGALERSALYRLVVEREVSAPSGRPIALIVGDLYVDGSESDVRLVAGMGALAAQAGGAFIAGAQPSLIGVSELSADAHWSSWSEPDSQVGERLALLRRSPVAPFVGLAMPRLLGRVPYGQRSDPIERLAFEELLAGAAHEQYLWINPAFGCAQLLAASFAQEGWDLRLGSALELANLPLAAQLGPDGERIKPCAEVCFDASSAERVLGQGVMPWLSYRDRNAARLLCFQSIAEPAAPLSGPWQ
jgi:type VI secretion system protein ImpC